MKWSIVIMAVAVFPVAACSAFVQVQAPACDRPGQHKRVNHRDQKSPSNHPESYESPHRPGQPGYSEHLEGWASADREAHSDLPFAEQLAAPPHVHGFPVAMVAVRESVQASTASWAQVSELVSRLFVPA